MIVTLSCQFLFIGIVEYSVTTTFNAKSYQISTSSINILSVVYCYSRIGRSTSQQADQVLN